MVANHVFRFLIQPAPFDCSFRLIKPGEGFNMQNFNQSCWHLIRVDQRMNAT